MKDKILKIIVVILIISFFSVGLVPSINTFLKEHITDNQYGQLIFIIVFLTFEIIYYLKTKVSPVPIFNSILMNKYKKETKYKENKNFYYRDLPLNKNIFKIFWIALQYDIIENKTNILNALLLKWCQEGRIKFLTNGKYEILNNEMVFNDSNEADLYNLLKNKNKNKFIRLSIFNLNGILKKIDEILLKETNMFCLKNKVSKRNNQYIILNTIKEDVDQVFGFKNFLLNFGNIKDKTPNEVKLWEEYLIYAELLGISKKVRKILQKANIDFSSRETSVKRINRKVIFIERALFCFHFILVGFIFWIQTLIIWIAYIALTWDLDILN